MSKISLEANGKLVSPDLLMIRVSGWMITSRGGFPIKVGVRRALAADRIRHVCEQDGMARSILIGIPLILLVLFWFVWR